MLFQAHDHFPQIMRLSPFIVSHHMHYSYEEMTGRIIEYRDHQLAE